MNLDISRSSSAHQRICSCSCLHPGWCRDCQGWRGCTLKKRVFFFEQLQFKSNDNVNEEKLTRCHFSPACFPTSPIHNDISRKQKVDPIAVALDSGRQNRTRGLLQQGYSFPISDFEEVKITFSLKCVKFYYNNVSFCDLYFLCPLVAVGIVVWIVLRGDNTCGT